MNSTTPDSSPTPPDHREEPVDPATPIEGLAPESAAELAQPPPEEVAVDIDPDEIQDAAKEREKQRPLIQRILKVLRRDQSPFREIVINSEPLETRVALLVNGVLEKYEVEREGEERLVGAIFKGRIQNLEHGLKAAFVDVGLPKNAFLHFWDILPAASDSSVEIVRDNLSAQEKARREKVSLKDIPKLYPIGTDIVVQITKSTIGTKGPRTTTNLAIPGRYLVLMPYTGQCGISRKIEDSKERQRLKRIIRELTIPEGMGVIIRTAGEGKKVRYFVRDLHILMQTWADIQKKLERTRDAIRLYQEPDLVERTVRDFLTEDIDRIIVDDASVHERMLELTGRISPRSRNKITLFPDHIPVFERFNIERQIEQTFQRKVPLPSGGEIVIQETEALIAIDVNTGAHKQRAGDNNNFILQVNLEAAREIARQIRLRNIGGLIILDFIDMKNPKDRKAVLRVMKEEMAKDKAKSHILPISALGIMQMTRQRHQESNTSGIYSSCPYCLARGLVKSPRTMSVEIQRRLVSVLRRLQARTGRSKAPAPKALRVYLHPHNLERIRTEDERRIAELERSYGVRISFRADPAIHIENFKIFDAQNAQELR